MFDLLFYYKYIGRYVLFLKYSLGKYSFKQMLNINNFTIYYNLINIIDLDQFSISNYFFFFRYFFGILPYYTNHKHKFHLNIHYFSYFLQYHLKYYNCYNYIYIFLNDIYSIIHKAYISFENTLKFLEFIILDMNFFIEKKNTLGFFSLIHSVKFKYIWIKNIEIKNLNLFFLLKFKI